MEEITETAQDSEKNNDKQPHSRPEPEPEQEDKVRRRRSIKVVQSVEEPKAEVKDEIEPPKEDTENVNVEVDNLASGRSKSADKDETPSDEPLKVNDDNKSAESETDEEDRPIAAKRRKSNSKVSHEEDEASSEDNRPLAASRRRKSVIKTLSPKKDAANPRRRSKRSLSPKKYNDSSESTVSVIAISLFLGTLLTAFFFNYYRAQPTTRSNN